jgi:hypothetical protein
VITFDHERLVMRHPTEMRRFRSWLLGAGSGTAEQIVVAHEDDHSCCRRESWNLTAAAIVEALQPPVPTVMINVNPPGVSP